MDPRGESKRVAIACQGGGSHTAFTAGVLKKLLRSEEFKRYEVVGLSGTSGGAVCALLAWHHLLRGDGPGAAKALDAFWRDNSATAPHEQLVNSWILWASNLQNFVTMPALSPYDNPFFDSVLEEFKRYEVVGLSGTSGGAVCALLAWHNLLRGDGPGAAKALDERAWRTFATWRSPTVASGLGREPVSSSTSEAGSRC